MFFITIMMEEQVMEVDFLINLVSIIAGLVDGRMKYMANIQHKLFIMIIYLEQRAKKSL